VLRAADRREDLHRAGMLLRIGEYLDRSGHGEGSRIKTFALEAIAAAHPKVAKKLGALGGEALRDLVDAVELQDVSALPAHFSDYEEIELVRSFVPEGAYVTHWGTGGHTGPVRLPITTWRST
jgi:hypothetical protein